LLGRRGQHRRGRLLFLGLLQLLLQLALPLAASRQLGLEAVYAPLRGIELLVGPKAEHGQRGLHQPYPV
jgi:hypothetical protein